MEDPASAESYGLVGSGDDDVTDRVRDRFRDHVVVCDGAMGSELLVQLENVSELDMAPLEHPKEVLEVHLRFLKAGAEMIETATFAASRPRLDRHHAGDHVERVNSEAVKLAREAREIAGCDCLIAGSIGPSTHSAFGSAKVPWDVTVPSRMTTRRLHDNVKLNSWANPTWASVRLPRASPNAATMRWTIVSM